MLACTEIGFDWVTKELVGTVTVHGVVGAGERAWELTLVATAIQGT